MPARLVGAVAIVALLAACGGGDDDEADDASVASPSTRTVPDRTGPDRTGPDRTGPAGVQLPPEGGSFDYQLGEGYTPAEGVLMVVRDRTDTPEPGLFNVCYVNGYQTQHADSEWWLAEHPDLITLDGEEPVVDPHGSTRC